MLFHRVDTACRTYTSHATCRWVDDHFMYVFLFILPVVIARNDAQDNFTLTVIIDMNVLTTLNNDKVYEL